ncbi:MAG: hypothetical protein P8Y97_16955 [Candidatus Lokiarchaeota archaeon]
MDNNFNTEIDQKHKKDLVPIIPSGDSFLDTLLYGGFRTDLLYLLYGERKLLANILLKVCVNSQIILNTNDNKVKVAFVDGFNRFNPYKLSKYAVSKRQNPSEMLRNILITRAFTWEQMVEILENKITQLDNVKVLIISGITSMFEYDQNSFQDLNTAISGIKKVVEKLKPLIILTSSLNKYSEYKPEGGKIMSHFGNVLVLITEDERYVTYSLIQHPSLPESSIKRRKSLKPKQKIKDLSRYKILDNFF